MKKSFFLLLLTSFVFASCAGDANKNTANTNHDEHETHNNQQAHQNDTHTTATAETSGQTSQDEIDNKLIQEYITENNLKAKRTPEGIYYIIETEGTGTQPTVDDQVEVHYKGTLLDGTEFDSSYKRGKTITFPLKGVIRGWQIGIPLIKEGGKGKLIIPSSLAYGSRQVGNTIKPNSPLVFDVELIDVVGK